MKKIQIIMAAAISLVLFFSCKKDSFINSSDARLSVSADTLKFDTVLTTVGSITQSLKIFNDNDQKLLLSKVRLMGGPASSYNININGLAATEADNIEVAANDSIYVFVTVNIDPSAANLPFIISDSILVEYNGNTRFVQLQAYGQNAHFLNSEIITMNTIWTNDLPYVIINGIQVDTNISLTINEGCRIYSHANAPFLVDGSLIINGTKGNEIIFASDRLDEPYKNFPAGWPGIYLQESSKDNAFTFAIVKNAYQGIVVQGPSLNSNPKLILHHCIIDNAYDVGLFGINTSVQADNTLISNCGKNLNIILGGNYSFSNCTVAAFSNSYLLHKLPVLIAENFADQGGVTITADLDATFVNCIFWGEEGILDDEVIVNKQGATLFNVSLDHCLFRGLNDPANATLNVAIKNIDPLFDSIDVNHNYYDFRITKNSFAPGIDVGLPSSFPKDLDNNNRSVGLPDLGSYEKQ
ncbi:MAG: hypothetical protein ABIO04_08825 [Ferruginibacter sp.]